MRVTCAVLNVANAAIVALITLLIFHSAAAALLTGCAYAVFPTALYLTDAASSEILFVFIVGLSCIGLLSFRGLHRLWAAVGLGLGCLVRSNFILLPFGLAVVAVLRGYAHSDIRPPRRMILLAVILFLAPISGWIVRNYLVSGLFPIVSTIRGETFYGANNWYVASSLDVWGYWVFPDEIPGEVPKARLAQSMSEAELDAFYFQKGMDYVLANWLSMPRLLLGKLLRGYAPIPWSPDLGSYVAFSYRGLLYLAVLLAFYRRRQPGNAGNAPYEVLVLAMMLANIATALVFYGAARLTFTVEPFLLPLAARVIEPVIGQRARHEA